ncbi:MAG: GUN4 domain-containing protein [Spirulinaceae cyanobacterium]
MAQNWAICVGINGYEFMPPLRYAENDASAMAEFFKSAHFQQIYTFTDHSPPIEDGSRPYKSQPTYTRLKWFLRDRFNQPFLQPGDNLWFFFSGHGVNHQDRDYLLAIDSDAHPAGIEETAIPVSDVAERLRRCGATNVILILDACRNEQNSKDAGLHEIHEPGIITLTSCSRGERSYEIEALEQGVFTYALRESLALTGERNCATVERLYKRVRVRVKALNGQYNRIGQTPYASVEPPDKFYTILLPRQATGQDIQQYKTCAYRAEAEGNLQQAHAYWDMLLEISPGDQEVKRKFGDLCVKIADYSAPMPEPVVSPNNTGSKTPTAQTSSQPLEQQLRPSTPSLKLPSSQLSRRYQKLEQYLRLQDWRKANEETTKQMLDLANRTEQGYLDLDSIDIFSCEDLIRIDKLWMSASRKRFGFSAQLSVWQRIGGKVDDESDDKLKVKLGWTGDLADLEYKSNAPKGHLPNPALILGLLFILSRFKDCKN